MVKTKEKTTQAINIFGKEIVLTKLGCPVISIRNDDKIDVRITTPKTAPKPLTINIFWYGISAH